jgi:hypothetical protein
MNVVAGEKEERRGRKRSPLWLLGSADRIFEISGSSGQKDNGHYNNMIFILPI